MSNDTIGNGTARGLRAILQPPREDSPTTEAIRAGESIEAILRILEGVPDRQVGNVFAAVQAIRRTAAGESIEAIREGFHALDQRRRESNGKRRGWFRR